LNPPRRIAILPELGVRRASYRPDLNRTGAGRCASLYRLSASPTGLPQWKAWRDYLLGVIVAAYRELERRTELVTAAPGAKRTMVQDVINHFLGEFTIKDVERACPTVGRDMIRLVLKELRAEGRIEPVGRGRGAKWKRMG